MNPTYEDQLLKLEAVPNARQLGGYLNKNGKRVKKDRLIRTGGLYQATPSDVIKLSQEIGIKVLFDLRSDSENTIKTDKDIPGAEYINLDLLNNINNQEIKKLFKEKNQDKSEENSVLRLAGNQIFIDYISDLYNRLINDEVAQTLLHRLFKITLATKGAPVLWHCTYGKDRTGIVAWLMLHILEVDMTTIKEDYLRTNISYQSSITKMVDLAKSKKYTEKQIWAVKSMVGVAEESFDNAIENINKNYGGMTSYIRNQIKLTQEDIELFKEYYLE